jgi:hypothetical protein
VAKDRIYQCRREYSDFLLSDITDYHEKLLAATASGAGVSDFICSHPSEAGLCAAEQLWILDGWLDTEGLADGLDGGYWDSLWMSDYRSPIDFFHPVPSTRDLAKFHKDDHQEECGLTHLAATIRDNGKMRLFQWMSESGMGSQMATAEHIAYMAEQKRKLSH